MSTTEIILKEPVHGLGAEADIVRVKPGYARNYLIPRGIAIVATAGSKRQLEVLQQKRAEREARELNDAQDVAKKLNKVTLTFQMQTGEGSSKVFGSVTSQDVVARLAEMDIELEKKKLVLPHPIKTIGETQVQVNLGYGVQAKIKVVLSAPKSEEEVEAADSKKKKDRPVRAKKTKSESEE